MGPSWREFDYPTRIDICGRADLIKKLDYHCSEQLSGEVRGFLKNSLSATLLCFFGHDNQRPPAAGVRFAFILAGRVFFYLHTIESVKRRLRRVEEIYCRTGFASNILVLFVPTFKLQASSADCERKATLFKF